MNFVYNARYEEGKDLTEFIIRYEDAINALNQALNTDLGSALSSTFLYNAMPKAWENEMRIWRSTRAILPYDELKMNLEAHVTSKQALGRYAFANGTPESSETAGEKALTANAAGAHHGLAANVRPSTATCGYCDRTNHTMVQCRVLIKDMRLGQLKANTVLPANFKFPSESQSTDNRQGQGRGSRHHPYGRSANNKGQRSHGNRGYSSGGRGHGGRGNQGYTQSHQGNQGFHGGSGYDQSRHDSAMIAITMTQPPPTEATFGLAVSMTAQVDPVWTIDSGCTRHVTYNDAWFSVKAPYTGSITDGGKNQIPIEATGDISLCVTDSKGHAKTLKLRNVLYAPALKFNLMSVAAAVKDDFRFAFNRTQCVINTSQHFSVKVKIADKADLYQFTASPTTVSHGEALVANHGTA
ncbi:hypothetical protein ATCC90586_010629 [Pythium insidiosum]|nr:hypothetical protein ATCC90586_010629 [Pythium insidiosum]